MYGKLFAQMYDGTLGTKGPWKALVTFQQLIILADKDGVVDMTADAISRRTTIPLEIIETGLKALLESDPHSRSPDEDGRRIVPISDSRDWGWRIVNYAHYRKIRSEEERREYHRQYMRRRREAVKQNVKVSTGGDQCQPIAVSSKQYAEAKKKNTKVPRHLVEIPEWLPETQWTAYLEMRQRIRKPATAYAQRMAIAKLEELRDAGHHPAAVLGQSVMNSWQGLFPLKDVQNG